MSVNKLNQGVAGLSLRIDTPAQTNMLLNDKPAMANGMFMQLPVAEIEFFDIFQDESNERLSLRELEVMFGTAGLVVSHKTLNLFFFKSTPKERHDDEEQAFCLPHGQHRQPPYFPGFEQRRIQKMRPSENARYTDIRLQILQAWQNYRSEKNLYLLLKSVCK